MPKFNIRKMPKFNIIFNAANTCHSIPYNVSIDTKSLKFLKLFILFAWFVTLQ